MYFEGPLKIDSTDDHPGHRDRVAFALPFLDNARSSRPRDRRRVLGAVTIGVLALGGLAAISLAKDARDPAFAKARADEQVRTDSAFAFARMGIPASGDPFENDPLRRSRAVWDERCAGCHGLAGTGGDKGPDLKDYNSRAWIRGFLMDPDGALYMGPAKLEKGMRAVEGTRDELDALTESSTPRRARPTSTWRAPDAAATCFAEGLRHVPRLRRRRRKRRPQPQGTRHAEVDRGRDRGRQPRAAYAERNKMPKFASKLTPAEIAELASFVYGLRAPK